MCCCNHKIRGRWHVDQETPNQNFLFMNIHISFPPRKTTLGQKYSWWDCNGQLSWSDSKWSLQRQNCGSEVSWRHWRRPLRPKPRPSLTCVRSAVVVEQMHLINMIHLPKNVAETRWKVKPLRGPWPSQLRGPTRTLSPDWSRKVLPLSSACSFALLLFALLVARCRHTRDGRIWGGWFVLRGASGWSARQQVDARPRVPAMSVHVERRRLVDHASCLWLAVALVAVVSCKYN